MTGCVLLDSDMVARQNGKRLLCEHLMAENAKLRELVKHLYECAQHNTCAACEYADDCDLDHDMRDLGVVER